MGVAVISFEEGQARWLSVVEEWREAQTELKLAPFGAAASAEQGTQRNRLYASERAAHSRMVEVGKDLGMETPYE
jgi:hypothetical protein